MLKRRVFNEINKIFPESMQKYNLLYKIALLDDPGSYDINNGILIGIIDKNNNLILKMWCKNEYPFHQPTVNVIKYYDIYHDAFIKYDIWAGNISKKMNKPKNYSCDYYMAWAFANISKPELANKWKIIPSFKNCLCCESITCSNNWVPKYTLVDILIEYITHRDFSIYSSKLMQRQINRVFNNDKWILPNDIILHILNFIIILKN